MLKGYFARLPLTDRFTFQTELVAAVRSGSGLAGRYVSRDPAMNLANPFVYVYDRADEAVALDDMSIVLTMLEDYCAHLRTIREMVGIYHTAPIVKDNSSLWILYKKAKK